MVDKRKAVFEFVKKYPPLNEKIRYNALVYKPEQFSINTLTNDIELKRYTGNLVKKQFTFAIEAIKAFDKEGFTEINLDELYEFEQFSKWIKEQYSLGNLPEIDNITKMKADKINYDGNDGKNLAKYSFVLTIEYLEQEEE